MSRVVPYCERTKDDVVVVIFQNDVQDRRGRSAPFFRVYSDRATDFSVAISWLRPIWMPGAGIRTCVECVLLNSSVDL